jgi:hypothetical protein
MISRFSKIENKFIKHFISKEQYKRFNQPFQVGTFGDNPINAIQMDHVVEDKDIVILATDG